jgi:hypothetical protein
VIFYKRFNFNLDSVPYLPTINNNNNSEKANLPRLDNFVIKYVSDPDWTRIQLGQQIRIRIWNPEPEIVPQKRKKRSFMFEEFSGGLEVSNGA